MKTKRKNNIVKPKLQPRHHPPIPKKTSSNTIEECPSKTEKPFTRKCLLRRIFRQLEADGLA
jgi:hypothetical protein